jgi:hypothetical protein
VILAIDPGTRESAYCIRDATRPVEWQKISNGELLRRIEEAPISSSRWGHLTSLAIEMPAVAMTSGGEIFHTCRWVGMFQHAWISAWGMNARAEDVHLMTRHQVKLFLLGRTNQKGADKLVRAALIARYGGKSSIAKGGVLHGVTGDCWAALAVAETYLNAPKLSTPQDRDAAIRQDVILWNTGSGVAP